MATARVERRLAADIVGYSRLMERDEAATFARLKQLRHELVEPILQRRGGRFVDLKGDGAIVEFGSVVDAVEAAVEIQRAMLEQDAALPEGECLRYRIGINLGDVIVDGGTTYGDGVNVAARIEGLCEPGGVWVSRSVRNQVKGKLDLAFAPTGLHQVKNISEVVETFRCRPRRRDACFASGSPGDAAQALTALCRGGAGSGRVPERRLAFLAGGAAAEKACDRGASVREPGRRRGDRPLIRGHHRKHHHRPRAVPRIRRDRPQLDRGLQGQGGRRPAGW